MHYIFWELTAISVARYAHELRIPVADAIEKLVEDSGMSHEDENAVNKDLEIIRGKSSSTGEKDSRYLSVMKKAITDALIRLRSVNKAGDISGDTSILEFYHSSIGSSLLKGLYNSLAKLNDLSEGPEYGNVTDRELPFSVICSKDPDGITARFNQPGLPPSLVPGIIIKGTDEGIGSGATYENTFSFETMYNDYTEYWWMRSATHGTVSIDTENQSITLAATEYDSWYPNNAFEATEGSFRQKIEPGEVYEVTWDCTDNVEGKIYMLKVEGNNQTWLRDYYFDASAKRGIITAPTDYQSDDTCLGIILGVINGGDSITFSNIQFRKAGGYEIHVTATNELDGTSYTESVVRSTPLYSDESIVVFQNNENVENAVNDGIVSISVAEKDSSGKSGTASLTWRR